MKPGPDFIVLRLQEGGYAVGLRVPSPDRDVGNRTLQEGGPAFYREICRSISSQDAHSLRHDLQRAADLDRKAEEA